MRKAAKVDTWGMEKRIPLVLFDTEDHGTSQSSPKSLPEFQRVFPDDQACLTYLCAARFPEGFVCPYCGCSGQPYRSLPATESEHEGRESLAGGAPIARPACVSARGPCNRSYLPPSSRLWEPCEAPGAERGGRRTAGAQRKPVAIVRVPGGIGRTRRVSRGLTRHSDTAWTNCEGNARRSILCSGG